MKSAANRKRAFNAVAWIAFGLMSICLVRYTSGNLASPFVRLTDAMGNVLTGSYDLTGYLSLGLFLAIVVLWGVFAGRNIKKKTTHYSGATDITAIIMISLTAYADYDNLVNGVKSNEIWTLVLVILMAVFFVFALIAAIFSFIQIGQEERQNEDDKTFDCDCHTLESRISALEKECLDIKKRMEEKKGGESTLQPSVLMKKDEKEEKVASEKEKPVKNETVVSVGKNKLDIPRVPFKEKILQADGETKKNYNAIKNHLIAYNAKSRISVPFDTFHYGMDTLVKISVNQKSLKVYFALPPKSFASTPYPIEDASKHKNTEAVPSLLKVRSSLSVRRAIKLIDILMEKKNIHLKAKAPAEKDYVQEIKKSSK